MCFGIHYAQSNSSLPLVRGNSVKCSIEQTEGNTVLIDSGLKKQLVCNAQCVSDCMIGQTFDYVGVEELEDKNVCAPKLILPKALYRVHQKELAWFFFSKLPYLGKWPFKMHRGEMPLGCPIRTIGQRGLNLIPGFIVNSVNGGYAVAIGGYIAFLPKSLRLKQKVRGVTTKVREVTKRDRFHSRRHLSHTSHRQLMSFYSIVKMNPQIKNIVVRERLVLRPQRLSGRS